MSTSKQLFQLLLFAYPREFRLVYGSEMTQVFCDCYRDSNSRGLLTTLELWLRVVLDVIQTAPLERWESLGKGETMRNLKRDALGLLACLAIIFVALLLHRYVVKTGFGSTFLLGYALDAIVTAGVVGNLIIFVLMMATRRSTFRTALWSLLIVNGVLLGIAILLGILVGGFNLPAAVMSYVVSFVFWTTIHWVWSQIRTPTEPVV
jgi:hypothetical protein